MERGKRMIVKSYDNQLDYRGCVKIPLYWSKDGQFFLSITNLMDGIFETQPMRIYNDGTVQYLGDYSVWCANSLELVEHLNYANGGMWSFWEYPKEEFNEDDVCRNGKLVTECECC
jgi:hypothetical protein